MQGSTMNSANISDKSDNSAATLDSLPDRF